LGFDQKHTFRPCGLQNASRQTLFGKGRAKTRFGKHRSTKPPLASTFAGAVCYAHFVFILSKAERRKGNQIFVKGRGFNERGWTPRNTDFLCKIFDL